MRVILVIDEAFQIARFVRATRELEVAVKLNNVLATRALVQTIDILCDK